MYGIEVPVFEWSARFSAHMWWVCLEVMVPVRSWGLHLGICCLIVRRMFLWQRFNRSRILKKKWKFEFLSKDSELGNKHLEQILWTSDRKIHEVGKVFVLVAVCCHRQESAAPAWFSLLLPVLVVPRKIFCWSDFAVLRENSLLFPPVWGQWGKHGERRSTKSFFWKYQMLDWHRNAHVILALEEVT